MVALNSAAAGANGILPGAGQLVQTGIKVGNRTLGYFSELGGILGEGLLETFALNDSDKSDMSKSLFGRVISGLAQMRPASPTMAGQTNRPVDDGAAKNTRGHGGGDDTKQVGPQHVTNNYLSPNGNVLMPGAQLHQTGPPSGSSIQGTNAGLSSVPLNGQMALGI